MLTLKGNTNWVYHVSLLNNGCLVSSSHDRLIKIWKVSFDAFECVKTIEAHDKAILKTIQLSNNRMASCSNDKKIKIFQSDSPYKELKIIEGHNSGVCSILELSNKKFIISCGFDKTVRFWDNNTYTCIKIINNISCLNNNSFIEINFFRILVGETNGTISIISTETFQIENRFFLKENINTVLSLLYLGGGITIAGDLSGNLIQLDINECKVICYKEKAHEKGIYDLLLIDKKIFSCSNSGCIKKWEI